MTRHRGVKASLQGYRAPLSRCTLSRPPRDDEPGGVSLLPSPLPYACPKAVVTQKYVEQQVYEIFRLGFMNRKNDLHPFIFEQSVHTGVVMACFEEFSKTLKKKRL